MIGALKVVDLLTDSGIQEEAHTLQTCAYFREIQKGKKLLKRALQN